MQRCKRYKTRLIMNIEKNNNKTENWTDSEKAILQHERLMAEVKKIRQTIVLPKEKMWWQWILESKVLAVSITVLVGGIFGNLINSNIQEAIKDREFRHDVLKALNSTQLELQKEYFKLQVSETKKALDVVGKIIQNTEALAITRTPEWSLNSAKTQKIRESLRNDKIKIRTAFNKAQKEWEVNQHLYGSMLSFYFYGDPEVSKAWDNLFKRIEDFINYASFPNPSKTYTTEVVEKLKQLLDSKIKELQQALLEARFRGIVDWVEKVKNFSTSIK